jgi:hypothetical protein
VNLTLFNVARKSFMKVTSVPLINMAHYLSEGVQFKSIVTAIRRGKVNVSHLKFLMTASIFLDNISRLNNFMTPSIEQVL